MAQLTQQVVAAERFLLGLRSLPKYEELRSKQIERLLNLIPKQAVSLSEAGSLVSSLRADIWGDQHVATLKEALASAVEDSAEDTCSIAGLRYAGALLGPDLVAFSFRRQGLQQ